MNYNEVIAALQVLGAIPQNSEDSNFQKIVPAMFRYADGRIYREIGFLATDVISIITLPVRQREVKLPDNVLTVRSLAVCTPPGNVVDSSRRHFPERVSPEALDMFWPQGNFKPAVPRKYAVAAYRQPREITPNPLPPDPQPLPPIFTAERFFYTIRLMPAPDRSYPAELYGGVEPEVLSENNPETLLSRYYAELLIAACMVYITGYQRDYGAQSDDPQRAMSWEAQYTKLKDGVMLEEVIRSGQPPAVATAMAAAQPRG